MINKKIFKVATRATGIKYIDLIYDIIIEEAPKYGIDTPTKLLVFLSQVGVETGGFMYGEETASGNEYEGRKDLGNTQVGDGKKYKGRGFLQTTGRKNYTTISRYLKYDFIEDPSQLSPTNSELRRNVIDREKLRNAVLSAMNFWQMGARGKNINNYASKIDINTFSVGSFYSIYPWNDSKDGVENNKVRNAFNISNYLNNEKNKTGKFLADVVGLDRNSGFYYFELCSLSVNGGYNGYRERLTLFVKSISMLKDNDYKANNINNNYDNTDQSPIQQNSDINEFDNNTNNTNNTTIDNLTKTTAFGGITNFFKPSIDISPIEFNVKADQDTSRYSDIGYTPFVWFNDIQISIVESFFVSCEGIVPTLKIDFIDRESMFNAKNFPLDNSKIKIFLNSGSTYLKPIMLEFKILKFTKDELNYSLDGILNVDYLLLQKYDIYPNKSSFDCLMEFAKKAQLGFSSNINSTNDIMNWLSVGYSGKQFIESVVDHSYLSDDAFLNVYIDFYYNLVYVDLETQLKLNVSEELGIFNTPISDMGNRLSKNNTQDVTSLYLTNDDSHKDNNNYIKEYIVFNNSTETSINNGYIARVKYYDVNSKELSIFDIDSISSEGDLNIALKGSTNDKYFFENNNTTTYEGKIDKSNMHKNYHYASVQNSHNTKELEKIGMELSLDSPNYNLYKFQMISIVLTHQAPDFLTPKINKRLSGNWLIVGISYNFIESSMTQTIKLIRRNLGILDDEQLPTEKSAVNTSFAGDSNNFSSLDIIPATTDDIFTPEIAPRFDTITATDGIVNINFSEGDGNSYLVIMKEGGDIIGMPNDDVIYIGNNKFGMGSVLESGEYVVYSGSTKTMSISISELRPSTTYNIVIYSYNSNGTVAKYLTDECGKFTIKTEDKKNTPITIDYFNVSVSQNNTNGRIVSIQLKDDNVFNGSTVVATNDYISDFLSKGLYIELMNTNGLSIKEQITTFEIGDLKPVYKISIKNPTNEADKAIVGNVKIITANFKTYIEVIMSGFSDFGVIEYKTTPLIGSDIDSVVNNSLFVLEDMIRDKYNVQTKLSYIKYIPAKSYKHTNKKISTYKMGDSWNSIIGDYINNMGDGKYTLTIRHNNNILDSKSFSLNFENTSYTG